MKQHIYDIRVSMFSQICHDIIQNLKAVVKRWFIPSQQEGLQGLFQEDGEEYQSW